MTARGKPYFPDNHVLTKLHRGKSKRMTSNPGQALKNHQEFIRKDRRKRTDNIHGSVILETDATSQTLPLYSDVQKRVAIRIAR